MQYKNKWVVAAERKEMCGNPIVCEISRELRITMPTAQLLVNRGCLSAADAKRFLAKEEEQLHDPFVMKDMEEATVRILDAVENHEKITIFGD